MTYYAVGLDHKPDGTNVAKKDGHSYYYMSEGKWVFDSNPMRFWSGEREFKKTTKAKAQAIAVRVWKGNILDIFD